MLLSEESTKFQGDCNEEAQDEWLSRKTDGVVMVIAMLRRRRRRRMCCQRKPQPVAMPTDVKYVHTGRFSSVAAMQSFREDILCFLIMWVIKH